MDEFVIAARQFLLVCGAVITIGGAWKVYKDFKSQMMISKKQSEDTKNC